MLINWTDHHVDETKRLIMPNTSPPPRRRGKEAAALGYTYDLRQDLTNRAGQTRSIYGSRGRAPAREDDHQAWHDMHNHIRGQPRTQMSSKLRRMSPDTEAPHTLCALLMR